MEGASNRVKRYVGQKLRVKKSESSTRLLLLNIGGLIGERLDEKASKLKDFSLKFDIDVLALNEIGQNEKRIEFQETVKEITRGWFEHMAVRVSTNRHFDSGQKRQYGGVGLTIHNHLATRILRSDYDSTGLGRWTSMVIQGKQGSKTRIISAYRPTLGTSVGSVNIQQHLYFGNQEISPRKKFMDDLAKAIVEWQNQGEKIILTGDMNTGDKMDKKAMYSFWKPFLSRTGLVDAHKSHLQEDWLPQTQERGSVQIDYVFISPSIKINRCGFLPFGKLPSDHRGLWVDFETESIVGLRPPKVQKFQARRLKLIDPRVVDRYQASLQAQISQLDLDAKIEKLFHTQKQEWSEAHTEAYQSIAMEYRRCMIKAEKRCRKLFKGAHSWSPEFDEARKRFFLWMLVVRHHKGLKVNVTKILKLKKQLKIQSTLVSSVIANQKLAEAKRGYKQVKYRSKRARLTYLESLAEALAEVNQTKKSSHIKALINREQIRESYRKIKSGRQRMQHKSFSSVIVKDPTSGKRRVITEKIEVEKCIMENNKSKFLQTAGKCPLMKGSLRRDIGTTASTTQSDKILQGKYKPPTRCKSSVKQFLKACKLPEGFVTRVDNHFSLHEYRRQWAKAKERTSSGEAHFGMWKAGARHPILGRLEWMLSTLPSIKGFSPDIWQKATDVMIVKASGNTDLDALRTVVLYEADFNFINKQIGRAAVRNAIQNGQMAEEQFAKSNSSPIDQCISRRIVFDLIRFQKASMVLCSSDLLSCYDRIVHSSASLAMQRYGIPKEMMHSMFSTIQHCQHKVRTGFGTSKMTYGGCKQNEEPLMGVGQGNGAGPAIWSILSCILFQIMHDNKMVTKLQAKLSDLLVEIAGFMYVDDNDLIGTGSSDQRHEVVSKTQRHLAQWNKLVKVTGGAIRIDKSSWYGYYHYWNNQLGEYELRDIERSKLTAKDENEVLHSLPHVTWSRPQKILGHLTSPDGESRHQVQKLVEMAEEEANRLVHSKLSQTECKLALTHTIMPRLTYPLTATTISKVDSKKILRPLLDICLPKMGLVKTLGYDYIHGSTKLQGLGIPELYHVSFGSQIEQLIQHLWRKTQTGKLIEMEIQELEMELGTGDIFNLSTSDRLTDVLITNHSWVNAIRIYARENKINIFHNSSHEHLMRENDRFLMEEMSKIPSNVLSRKELKAFNYCRIYKRTQSLAEIFDSAGTKIASRAWDKIPFSRGNESQYNTYHPPIHSQWLAWKKGLRALQRLFRYDLGRWKLRDCQRRKWDFFLDTVNRRLLLLKGKRWEQFTSNNRRWTGTLVFSKEAINCQEPNITSLTRVTVQITDKFLIIEGSPSLQAFEVTPPTSLVEVLTSIPQWEETQIDFTEWVKDNLHKLPETEWAAMEIEFIGNMDILLNDFKRGMAILVGDGSFKDWFGAGASLISSNDGKNYILISGITPGTARSQCAYRSEIGAMIGCVLLQILIAKAVHFTPKLMISCDNDRALSRVYIAKDQMRTSWQHADLISILIDLVQGYEGPIKTQEVKGHADQLKDYSSLTTLERLNMVVDQKAKECREASSRNIFRKPKSVVGYNQVYMHGTPVASAFSKNIQEEISRQRMLSAAGRLNRFQLVNNPPSPNLGRVDFTALERAMTRVNTARQIFLTKVVSRQLPVALVLKRRQHTLDESCPLCNQSKETVSHLLCCDSITSVAHFDAQIDKLEVALEQINTSPTIGAYIISSLQMWRRDSTNLSKAYPCSLMHKNIFKAFYEQDKLGWDKFLEGIISPAWALLQQEYIDKHLNGKGTGISWAVKLILHLWELLHSVWKHRNEIVHKEEQQLTQVQGGNELKKAILVEFDLGLGNLHKDFAALFHKNSKEVLQTKPLRTQIAWFKTVRTAREAIPDFSYDDAFSKNGPLRRWIGLSKLNEER